MAQESTSAKITENLPDTAALMAQLQALKDEVTRLAASAATAAQKGGEALSKEVKRDLSDARQLVARKGQEADIRVEHAIANNPYLSLGIVAGIGLLVGMLARR